MTLSTDLLAHLADRYAFDGTPMPHDLGAYHVPFDLMLGGDHVEARIQSGAIGGERVALIAGRGAGKSSVIRYVLGPAAAKGAPDGSRRPRGRRQCWSADIRLR